MKVKLQKTSEDQEYIKEHVKKNNNKRSKLNRSEKKDYNKKKHYNAL